MLNIYSTAPFFRTYFEALGIPKQNVVFSDATTEEMWVEGGKYGSIDPCYPSKVAQAHIHNLLFHHHTDEEAAQLHLLPDPHARAELRRRTRWTTRRCPIVAGAPDVMKAAFTKEVDFFADARHRVPRPGAHVRRAEPAWRSACSRPGARASASPRTRTTTPAARPGRRSTQFENDLQEKGRAILETVEAEDRVAILMLGRPYHSDPGLNHGIPEEFQVLGYPILSHPLDPEGPRVPRSLLQGGARRAAS